MEVEKLTLGVRHNHGTAAIGGSDELDHGVDEGRGFTGTGCTDDQRMHARLEVAD